MSNNIVPLLPPTYNVQDPAVRDFLEALSSAWSARSGQTDPNLDERFITKKEIAALTKDAVNDIFVGGTGGLGAPGTGGGTGIAEGNSQIIDNLATAIMNSALFQALGEQITTTLNVPEIFTRLGEVEAVASQTNTDQVTASSVVKAQFTLMGARVGNAEAAITSEQTIRVNKDNALAAAVNNIWAKIGGTTAAITDSQLASVTPSSAAATKWNSVVAAVTDPNTGQVSSAAILTETRTFASNVNSSMNASYIVKAQLSTGGATIVGGFGLMATTGAGSAQGPTIDFGIRADKFFVAATSATPNLSTQLSASTTVPFVIVTSNTTINSPNGEPITYTPGVYMNRARVKELYGTYVEAGTLRAGEVYIGNDPATNRLSTVYRDNKSGQIIYTTAISANYTASVTDTTVPYTNSSLRFYGPNYHSGYPVAQRVRNTDNNVLIPVQFTANGVVDHFFSLWYKYSGQSTWTFLAKVISPYAGDGGASISVGGLLSCASTEYIEFGIAGSDENHAFFDNGKKYVYDLSATITAVNT